MLDYFLTDKKCTQYILLPKICFHIYHYCMLTVITLLIILFYILEGVPYDGVPLNFTVSVHLSVTVTFSILATFGIVFAIICLILNIAYRKTK